MKKQYKSESQIESERREIIDLRQKIIYATNTIPKKIINDASYQAAVNFKDLALKARSQAEKKLDDVDKLRYAWSLISGYYA